MSDLHRVDPSSNVWIVGTTGSTRIPFTKPLNANFPATATVESFAVKLAQSGNTMAFGTLLDGTTTGTRAPAGLADSSAMGVQVDSIGSAYVAGRTDKLDYPTTTGAYQAAPRSNLIANAFVTKINETKDSPNDRFNLLKGIYTGMLDGLRAGNINDAMTALTDGAATKLQPVFTLLGAQLPSAVDRLGTIDRVTFSSGVAEIVISRTVGAQQMGYSIYLIRGPDGIWRIDSM